MRRVWLLVLVSVTGLAGSVGCFRSDVRLDASDRLRQVYRAHGGAVWEGMPTVAFELEVAHGPYLRMQQFVWHRPTGQIRFDERHSGTVMGFDGSAGWVSPAARQDDPPSGSYLQYIAFLMGAPFLSTGDYENARRVRLAGGMGDDLRFVRVKHPTLTNDVILESAVLGVDADSSRLMEMRYVLSAPYLIPANSSAKDWPRRLVRYGDFRDFEGMTLAHRWELFDLERGSDETTWVGTVRVKRIERTAPPPDSRFLVPEDGLED